MTSARKGFRRVGRWSFLALVVAVLALSSAWLVHRLDVPLHFWFSPLDRVSVEGRELRVVQVDYAQGLRGVTSLGGLDGALFVLDEVDPGRSVESGGSGMGMYDTSMPLDVIFFGPDARFIDYFTMPVCETEECPTFVPSGPWQFALEAPAGTLGWVSENAILVR